MFFAGESIYMTCDSSSIVMDGITDIQGQLVKMEGWVKGPVQVDEEEEDEDDAVLQLGLDVAGMIPVAGGGGLGKKNALPKKSKSSVSLEGLIGYKSDYDKGFKIHQYTLPVTNELTQDERELLKKYLNDLLKKSSINNQKQQKTNFVYKPDGHKISVAELASMIDQIQTIHYSRNILNAPPKTEKEAIKIGWKKMKKSESVYHQIGKGNKNNSKYVSPNGQLEAVYNEEGQLVIDPKNIGTYNFISPDDKVGHIKLDVIPYYIWGNSEEDTSTGSKKAKATLESFAWIVFDKIMGK